MLLVHDCSHCSASLAIQCAMITVVLQHQRINMLQSHNVYTTTLKERNQSYFSIVQIQPRLFFIVRYEVLIVVFIRIYVICNVMLC